MIAVSRDAAWIARMRVAAARGGWEFAATGEDSLLDNPDMSAAALLVVDRAAVRGALGRAVAGLRARFPAACIALCFSDSELGTDGVGAGLVSGADDVILKSWADERLFARLSSLRDAVLVSAVRISADGELKAEKRSRRVFHLMRGRWQALELASAEFALLWELLSAEGEAVSRERLLRALREAAGREVEAETVSRRALSLRRALAPWKGKIETVRGGFYRLVSSSRRRSTT